MERSIKITLAKVSEIFRWKETELINILDKLFNIVQVNALNLMKVDTDKLFLINQRLPGQIGYLGGIDN